MWWTAVLESPRGLMTAFFKQECVKHRVLCTSSSLSPRFFPTLQNLLENVDFLSCIAGAPSITSGNRSTRNCWSPVIQGWAFKHQTLSRDFHSSSCNPRDAYLHAFSLSLPPFSLSLTVFQSHLQENPITASSNEGHKRFVSIPPTCIVRPPSLVSSSTWQRVPLACDLCPPFSHSFFKDRQRLKRRSRQ